MKSKRKLTERQAGLYSLEKFCCLLNEQQQQRASSLSPIRIGFMPPRQCRFSLGPNCPPSYFLQTSCRFLLALSPSCLNKQIKCKTHLSNSYSTPISRKRLCTESLKLRQDFQESCTLTVDSRFSPIMFLGFFSTPSSLFSVKFLILLCTFRTPPILFGNMGGIINKSNN